MSSEPTLDQLVAALDAMRAEMAKAEPLIVDEGIRQQLRMYTSELDKAQAEVMARYPAEMARLERQMEETRQSAAATKRGLAELKAKAAAAKAENEARAKAAKSGPEPIDPNLGRTLRDEILARFGDGKPGAKQPNRADPETRDFLRNQRF
jgi:predicted  nucleic acid-binding Zn-ribbon protein